MKKQAFEAYNQAVHESIIKIKNTFSLALDPPRTNNPLSEIVKEWAA